MSPAAKATAELSRAEMLVIIRRFNPFGGYCDAPCKHPGHSNDAYRKTVAKIRREA